MRFFFTLSGLCAFALAAFAVPASAATSDLVNNTNVCVWFTVDTKIYTKIDYRNQAAGFVDAGKSKTFTVPAGHWAYKVRAEPRSSADCNSPKSADINIIRDHNPKAFDARISGAPPKFSLAWR
jgi:hypothetical protein